MAKYQIKEPDNTDKYEELARISFNLRYFSKIWKECYGSPNRANMVYWEEKLDKWHKDNIELVEEPDMIPDDVQKWQKAS